MKVYQTKVKTLPGTNYSEVYPAAWTIYKKLRQKSKRRPHVRSAYFNKAKIFFDYFWPHIRSKNLNDRARRLKFFSCALDLVVSSKIPPTSKEALDNPNIIRHRFIGSTKTDGYFAVQINQNKKNDQKYLISIFPWE